MDGATTECFEVSRNTQMLYNHLRVQASDVLLLLTRYQLLVVGEQVQILQGLDAVYSECHDALLESFSKCCLPARASTVQHCTLTCRSRVLPITAHHAWAICTHISVQSLAH